MAGHLNASTTSKDTNDVFGDDIFDDIDPMQQMMKEIQELRVAKAKAQGEVSILRSRLSQLEKSHEKERLERLKRDEELRQQTKGQLDTKIKEIDRLESQIVFLEEENRNAVAEQRRLQKEVEASKEGQIAGASESLREKLRQERVAKRRFQEELQTERSKRLRAEKQRRSSLSQKSVLESPTRGSPRSQEPPPRMVRLSAASTQTSDEHQPVATENGTRQHDEKEEQCTSKTDDMLRKTADRLMSFEFEGAYLNLISHNQLRSFGGQLAKALSNVKEDVPRWGEMFAVANNILGVDELELSAIRDMVTILRLCVASKSLMNTMTEDGSTDRSQIITTLVSLCSREDMSSEMTLDILRACQLLASALLIDSGGLLGTMVGLPFEKLQSIAESSCEINLKIALVDTIALAVQDPEFAGMVANERKTALPFLDVVCKMLNFNISGRKLEVWKLRRAVIRLILRLMSTSEEINELLLAERSDDSDDGPSLNVIARVVLFLNSLLLELSRMDEVRRLRKEGVTRDTGSKVDPELWDIGIDLIAAGFNLLLALSREAAGTLHAHLDGSNVGPLFVCLVCRLLRLSSIGEQAGVIDVALELQALVGTDAEGDSQTASALDSS